MFQWRDRATQEIVAEFDYARLADETEYPFVIQLEQHRTVYAALEVAKRFPLFTIHRPVQVMSVAQDADGVDAEVRHEDGTTEIHRGRYLLGCDGGRSIVRKATGVSFDGFTWPERFNIVTTTYDFAKLGFRLRNYCAHPERWVSFMKVPGEDNKGLWRCVFPAKTEETDEEVMSDSLDPGSLCRVPARRRSVRDRPPQYVQRCISASQETSGNGRIILAGDAAHINNPIGGMGMNSGFQDGLNAAEKLADIWNGAEPDRCSTATTGSAGSPRSSMCRRSRSPTSACSKRAIRQRARPISTISARIAADPDKHLDFVRRSSLIAMLEKSKTIK